MQSKGKLSNGTVYNVQVGAHDKRASVNIETPVTLTFMDRDDLDELINTLKGARNILEARK